ncbi:MAG: hypothetical protein AAF620_16145 [Bacteroidota bacterium]
MKKIFIVASIVLLGSIQANSQTIEIIDAIAGTLIPGITKGVKEVIDNGAGNNKKKEEAKKEVEKKIVAAQKELLTGLESEINNINTARTLYSESRKANSAIGALKAVTNPLLIQHAKTTDAIETKRQIALLYSQEWDVLNLTIKKIEAIGIASLDANLQQTLTEEKDKITEALNRVNTINSFNSGKLSWTGDISLDQANERITAIELSSEHISSLKSAIENIARVVDTRLQTYKLSFEKLKSDIEEKEE